jgi:RNA polymerase sigma factor (sigma-70 family)
MFEKATNEQLWAIYRGGDCPSHLFSELVKETMNREEFINRKMFKKATNEQLWVIVKHDKNCPTPLLVGVIHELIRRNELEKFICKVIINVYKSITAAEEFTFLTKEDLIQTGYEGTIEALQEYKQGHGTFMNYLHFVLMNKFKELSRELLADKRKAIFFTTSYHQEVKEGTSDSFEIFLSDNRINVEKEVIRKIMVEEKLNLLTPKQKQIFLAFLEGFTLQEIADKLGYHKSTIHGHLVKAIMKMAGKKINLHDIGVFERVSCKNTQGFSA